MSGLRLLSLMALGFALSTPVLAQSPAFSTQVPESGVIGSSFVVLLPVTNTGTGAATLVQVTTVTVGGVAATSPSLPLLLGSIGPGDSNQLVLQFDSSRLTVGGRYLLTIRGNYQSGGSTLGFSVNRILSVAVPGSSAQSDLRRWIVFDAVRAELVSLPHVDQIADGQAILNFVQSRPEFVASGIYPDYSSVWARFADGFPLIIGNDFYSISDSPTAAASENTMALQIGTGDLVAQQAARGRSLAVSVNSTQPKAAASASGDPPTELPGSSSFRLLNTLSQYGDPNLISNLTSWLQAQNYTSVGTDASVEGLKTVGGDGIFFFRTHGAFLSDTTGASVYGLWTSTAANFTNFADYFASGDLEPTNSPLMWDMELKAPGVAELHYSITAKFVEKYWSSFSQNSLVYIDACDSNLAADFKQEIFNEDASVYAGWPTNTGDPFAAGTARLVFDRLLGANQFCPETNPSASFTPCTLNRANPPIFPQRPFDYTAVSGTEFTFHGLGQVSNLQSKYFGTVLVFSGSGFGLLAPSISNMTVDETKGDGGQLTLNGIFGQDPRMSGSESDGVVTVGSPDNKATIESWNVNKIVVDLNLSGAGSSGDVQVTVRGHTSNVARLTEWRGNQFTYMFFENGSLQLQTVYDLHFRADIRQWRRQIHFPPGEPNPGVFSASDSTATFNASGTGPCEPSPCSVYSFNWMGSGSLVNFIGPTAPTNNTLGLSGIFNSHTQLIAGVTAESFNATTCQECGPGGCQKTSGGSFAGPTNEPSLNLAGPFSFTFTLDGTTADIAQDYDDESNLAGDCNDTLSTNGGAHSHFQWGPVPATMNTAPDPKSAR